MALFARDGQGAHHHLILKFRITVRSMLLLSVLLLSHFGAAAVVVRDSTASFVAYKDAAYVSSPRAHCSCLIWELITSADMSSVSLNVLPWNYSSMTPNTTGTNLTGRRNSRSGPEITTRPSSQHARHDLGSLLRITMLDQYLTGRMHLTW